MSTRYSLLASTAILLLGCITCSPGVLAQENSSTGSKPVASVNGGIVTEEELKKAAAGDLERIETQRLQAEAGFDREAHQVLEATLARLIEERLLDAEAARLGISRQELLAKEVDQKLVEPTEAEIDSVYESNKDRIARPKDQVASQIRQFLKSQSYNRAKGTLVERLKKELGATSSLDPFRFRIEPSGPSRGPAEAPVTLVEFSDFQCPFCKDFRSTLDRVLKEYSSDVRLVFRQLPLSQIHPQAAKAAEASLCASEQDRFWEMHDLMFQEQESLMPDELKAKAARLKLDTAAFNACLDSGRYATRVLQDSRDAAQAGVNGTPALFVNGRFLGGARPFDDVANIIKEELQMKKMASLAKP